MLRLSKIFVRKNKRILVDGNMAFHVLVIRLFILQRINEDFDGTHNCPAYGKNQ